MYPTDRKDPSAINNPVLRLTPPALTTPSPKRKRSDEDFHGHSPPELRIDTVRELDGQVEAGAESPRSKVAEKLQNLDIRGSELCGRPESPRKRLKRESRNQQRTYDGDDAVEGMHEVTGEAIKSGFHTPDQARPGADEQIMNDELEIPDSASIIPTVAMPYHPSTESPSTPPKFPQSPPPDQDRSSAPTPSNPTAIPLPPTPPLQSTLSPSPSRTDLTWQPTEITGHSLDPAYPDDDGEGINGVGFRPTPAMAYARRQKRRQQVHDWKTREARDARQRRMDRRRGSEGLRGAGEDPSGGRKGVRFAVGIAEGGG